MIINHRFRVLITRADLFMLGALALSCASALIGALVGGWPMIVSGGIVLFLCGGMTNIAVNAMRRQYAAWFMARAMAESIPRVVSIFERQLDAYEAAVEKQGETVH